MQTLLLRVRSREDDPRCHAAWPAKPPLLRGEPDPLQPALRDLRPVPACVLSDHHPILAEHDHCRRVRRRRHPDPFRLERPRIRRLASSADTPTTWAWTTSSGHTASKGMTARQDNTIRRIMGAPGREELDDGRAAAWRDQLTAEIRGRSDPGSVARCRCRSDLVALDAERAHHEVRSSRGGLEQSPELRRNVARRGGVRKRLQSHAARQV
jgi:hypothetical protein